MTKPSGMGTATYMKKKAAAGGGKVEKFTPGDEHQTNVYSWGADHLG